MPLKEVIVTVLIQENLHIEEIETPGYEKVIRVRHEEAGLDAIIAVHNTVLGPALGGIRIYPYPTFDAALYDVLRLSEGMTYKSALAETGCGGGKSVIIADPKKKTRALLEAFGLAVEHLQGMYICAEDSGCSPADLEIISEKTQYVAGLERQKSSGNPAPFTAWGVYRGIQSVLQKIYGSPSVEGKVIAIQGAGNVGSELASHLFWEGAKLVITDVDSVKTAHLAKRFDAQVVGLDEIFSVPCDVFAPCAMGGILNEKTIPLLRCKAVAGAANNQLGRSQDADLLAMRGILYAPDFVINAGGVINVAAELNKGGYQPSVSRKQAHALYDQLMMIYDVAEKNHLSTHKAAVSLGEHRLKYAIGKRQDKPYFHHAL